MAAYRCGVESLDSWLKTHYWRLLLQYVIAKIDTASNATEVTTSLVAIRWVALAWKEVKESTIMIKCFKTAGILNDTQEHIYTSEDPFEDIDETISLIPLISAAMGTISACSMSEYIHQWWQWTPSLCWFRWWSLGGQLYGELNTTRSYTCCRRFWSWRRRWCSFSCI